ncbi:MAG: cytochrome C oxidase subunit IV family protein [Verrucomicrobia bacterium]|nr:cytochrome C oxidase subunit IV family protein [Verrucomicrobiota bacterium]
MKAPTLATYVKTWLTLLLLWATTILLAHFDLGSFSLSLALLISILQASLILLFFMHLHYSKANVVVCACAAYLWLAILIVGTMHDYLSRNWIPRLTPQHPAQNHPSR